MKILDKICEAIMVFEGMKPGSRSYRNCNPGNLRWSKSPHEMDPDGYCKFDTFAQGWMALSNDILWKCQGKTRTNLTPDSTLIDLFKVYAPHEDSNDPDSYCAFVCKRANLANNMPLYKIAADWLGE